MMEPWLKRQVVLIRAGCLAAAVALAARGESVSYTLDPDFAAGTLRVDLEWRLGDRTRSALGVSRQWGPIEDVGRLLREVRIGGSDLRSDGTRWEFSHPRNGSIRASYLVAPRQRAFDDWRLTHHPITTRDFFHGMGAAFLMVPQPGAGTPEEFEVTLRWKLPAGYDAACSWGLGRHVGARIKAADLRSSVYLAGRLETARVPFGERVVAVAMIDRFPFSAGEFVQRALKIIEAQCRFLVERDFPDYVITVIPVGEPLAGGNARLAGTGLHHSFALFLAPGSVLNDAFEHLFAHELFHHWNGRLMGARPPERLAFWFIEGVTDYYALRILYEAGIWDAATYCKWLNKHLTEYAGNPARNASNEEIDRGYWSQRDTVGQVAYQRGHLLGLRWHALARQRGKVDGFDAVFMKLLNRARAGRYEVSNADVRRVGVDELGSWFAAEFDRHVTRAETIDTPTDALEPSIRGARRQVFEFDLGFDRERSFAARRVTGLRSDSRAAQAGLREGDRLLGWSVAGDADRESRLQIERAGVRREISYFPRGASVTVVQFEPAVPGE